MKEKKIFLIIMLSLFGMTMMAQTRVVTGKVTSSETGEALSGVTVRLKGAVTQTQTNNEGTYRIEVGKNSTDLLVFLHPDYDETEFFLNERVVADIQMNSSVRYNQYGVKVQRTPLLVEERNGILVMESKDRRHRVWYDVRAQADGAMFFGDTYNPIGNGTSIRRARFAVKTQIAEKWYGEFDMDISNSQLELKDAYVQRSFGDNFDLKVGNFKENYSMERTTTSRYLAFMERPMVINALTPSRHIGLLGTYHYKWLLAMGGIHFQRVDDIEERTYSLDNNKDLGIDEGYSFTGRLVFMPLYKDMNKGLHVGLAGSYRTPKTDAEAAGTMRYSTRSLTSINRKKYLDTDLIAKVDYSTLNGFELAGYYKNLRFQSEYHLCSVHRLENLETLNFNGGYIFGGWLLFGGKYNYNSNEGEFTQVNRGKSWGDIEIALRYDYLNLNSSMETLMGGAGEGITFGINYFANNNVKIMLNYAYLNHDRYASGKNKLFVGYDENGQLTRNPKLVVDGKGKAGEDFSMVSVRFEINF